MKVLFFSIAGAALALSSTTAHAAVTLDFPGPGTEWLSQGNGDSGVIASGGATNYMWVTDDYVRQTFSNTGLFMATSANGRFRIENLLGNMDLFVDVLLNGNTIGQFTIAACNFCGDVQDLGYSFGFAPVAGDDFNVEYRLANTISGGNGSIRWFDDGSDLTLVGNAVPEPTTWAMMLLGFGAIGFGMRRRKAEITGQRVGLSYT